jgi:hypothetical protein
MVFIQPELVERRDRHLSRLARGVDSKVARGGRVPDHEPGHADARANCGLVVVDVLQPVAGAVGASCRQRIGVRLERVDTSLRPDMPRSNGRVDPDVRPDIEKRLTGLQDLDQLVLLFRIDSSVEQAHRPARRVEGKPAPRPVLHRARRADLAADPPKERFERRKPVLQDAYGLNHAGRKATDELTEH